MGNSVEIDWDEGRVTAVRKLRSSGSSTVLTIPPEVYESVGLQEDDQVEIVADMENGKITLQPIANSD